MHYIPITRETMIRKNNEVNVKKWNNELDDEDDENV